MFPHPGVPLPCIGCRVHCIYTLVLHTAAEQSITAVHLIYQTDDIYNTRRANSEQQLGIHGECKGPCTESISAVIKNCDDASDSVFIKNNGVASSKCGSRISVAGTATNTNVSKFPKNCVKLIIFWGVGLA